MKKTNHILIIMIMVCFMFVNTAMSHENEFFKHGSTGKCFGWESVPGNMKLCYRDKEHNTCVLIIFAHGIFHVSKEFECKDYEKIQKGVLSLPKYTDNE